VAQVTASKIMYEWHRVRGIKAMHGRGWRDEKGRNYVRWCFADPATSEAFAAEFNGQISGAA
jgi:hypothetical protein